MSRSPLRLGVRGLMMGAGLGVVAGCGLLFSEPAEPPLSPPSAHSEPVERPLWDGQEPDIPGGHGTLRQEELAIRLQRGDLDIFLTPLAEWITRTGAPDTWARLSALEQTHRRWFRNRTGADTPYTLFLAVLYAEGQPMGFDPEALAIVSGGLRHRMEGVRPLTPGWDQGRVLPGEPQMAVYAFPPQIPLNQDDLEVEYHEVRSRDWSRLLPRIQAEQARIRSGPPQSRPNF